MQSSSHYLFRNTFVTRLSLIQTSSLKTSYRSTKDFSISRNISFIDVF